MPERAVPGGDPDRSEPIEVTDFVELAGAMPDEVGFECSSTVAGVSGALRVTPDSLVLRSAAIGASTQVGTHDIRSWRATPAGATFSLAVETGARHTVVLLSQFQAATVQAMTRAAGPAASLSA
ncbi:hypothetical protein C5C18_01705 [Rathayibacter tritici]|uniref:Uncharacterized protein n=1 Tax=Rathayibacter tritici TaxID=33888 RepID=A0A160KVG6_9MICO|nr:hypothetical protein [Rathayibacter tritici]AND17932.1 hypothetical protein A6122_2823 [Rathayibacter tritici]PPF28589.1 hypothetical protein C5C06_07730 [Rathayibacter tritici]PPF69847.1 hypothetical protein C5C21_02545 [Rathayibacter tritici]PPG09120.1 hypothetical protein C5C18_01705 [Rathayibacter tritici]PPI18006.1 hypothetical protein C5D07_03910 [Rathayibacter tritici]